jgi:hypothetical protein
MLSVICMYTIINMVMVWNFEVIPDKTGVHSTSSSKFLTEVI